MKKSFIQMSALLIILCSAFFCSECRADENEIQAKSCEKVYVLPEHIHIHQEGIIVHCNGQWFSTECLYHDVHGLYVQNHALEAYGCPDPYVSCRNCGRCVYEAWDICPYCKKPI